MEIHIKEEIFVVRVTVDSSKLDQAVVCCVMASIDKIISQS